MPDPVVGEDVRPPSFQELFGNSNPVEVEIGCGKGKFLLNRAVKNPDLNFLGIDRVGKWMKRRKTRVEREAILNIRFFKAEARQFLTEAVPSGSVSIFHVYFPDPWPKRRHQKRRTISDEFLKLLHSKLTPGGLVEIATDDADYFQAIKRSVALTGELWENVRESVNERILDGMNKTNYEIKWAMQGRSLYYAELKRR